MSPFGGVSTIGTSIQVQLEGDPQAVPCAVHIAPSARTSRGTRIPNMAGSARHSGGNRFFFLEGQDVILI